MHCGSPANTPRLLVGAISEIYTLTVLRYTPSPNPAIILPAKNCGRPNAVACRRHPTANKMVPRVMTRKRPCVSASQPAKKAGGVPASMMSETVKPTMLEERGPIEVVNCGMVVTAPTEPVSKPLRRPPRETAMEARMQRDGRGIEMAIFGPAVVVLEVTLMSTDVCFSKT